MAKWPAASQGFKITKLPAVWYFSQILRNQRNPSNSNYHMSINSCQAIQKSCIDRRSNTWFTFGSESETLVSLGQLLNDQQSKFREAILQYVNWEISCNPQKNFFTIIRLKWCSNKVSAYLTFSKLSKTKWQKVIPQKTFHSTDVFCTLSHL